MMGGFDEGRKSNQLSYTHSLLVGSVLDGLGGSCSLFFIFNKTSRTTAVDDQRS